MDTRFTKQLLLFAFVAGIGISCTKEYSCEGCIPAYNNNTNKPPLAIAGPDQVLTLPVDSAMLDGRASSDPDGTISSFQWTKIAGPSSFTFNNAGMVRTVVKSLTPGAYFFELRVTDNGGLSAKDTMRVIVQDPGQPNRPPIANAGPDQTLSLPVNASLLDGSASTDPDNNIVAYIWTQIAGPSAAMIVQPSAVQSSISSLQLGAYRFELKVTDAGGLFSKDTVQITVVNQLPPPCINCKIAFVSDRDGNSEIYSCNTDGSNVQRLTNDPWEDEQPAWSPDGTKIAFISNRTGGDHELYIMNSDGTNPVRKTFSGHSRVTVARISG
jgi:hypothetical protein